MTAWTLDPSVLEIDCAAEADYIAARMRELVGRDLRRRGVVVALSGGVDSSVCVALAVAAFGPDKVFVLLLPERESSAASVDLGRQVAAQFGVEPVLQEISAGAGRGSVAIAGATRPCAGSFPSMARGGNQSWSSPEAFRGALAPAIGVTSEQAALIYRDIQSKRATTRGLHSRALLIRPVPEVRPF